MQSNVGAGTHFWCWQHEKKLTGNSVRCIVFSHAITITRVSREKYWEYLNMLTIHICSKHVIAFLPYKMKKVKEAYFLWIFILKYRIFGSLEKVIVFIVKIYIFLFDASHSTLINIILLYGILQLDWKLWTIFFQKHVSHVLKKKKLFNLLSSLLKTQAKNIFNRKK